MTECHSSRSGCFVFPPIFITFDANELKSFRLKHIIGYSVIIQFFLLLSLPALSQFEPADVVRSQEKTMVNGKIYYIHTVQKGQTFYSICKAYGVTQEDVRRANPEIDPAYLKEGLAIRIPESITKVAAAYPENREDFYAHTVKKGQTVYSLSRKYNVSEEVIYHYNPWAREGIHTDQTLWIPRKKEMQDLTETARANDLFFYYTVKEKDTLFAIAQVYGVEVADIIDANPELKEGLKPGNVLKIPRVSTAGQDLTDNTDSLAVSEPCQVSGEPVVYNVALMLPFFAEFSMEEAALPADTLTEEGTYVPVQKQEGLRGRNFAEFYEGFMLAVDSLKSTGFSVALHVKDTERDTLKVKKIVKELSIEQPDLIIGPVYSEAVSITGRLARYQEVNLVSPLSTRHQLVNSNPNIFQVIPSRQAEGIALANYLRNFKKGRLILIRSTDSASMSNSWQFKKYLLGNMPVDSLGEPLFFKDYKLNDSLLTVLTKVMSKDDDNLIIVFSDSEADVSRLVSRIYAMASLYPVKMFGMPSWLTWKTIDVNYLHSLELFLITPFYTDYSSPAVKNFLIRSRDIYGYEPYEISSLGYNFCMLGYDIGFYFLSALRQYGKNFQQCLEQVDANQLLTRYHFVRSGAGGYINCSFVLIQYKKDFRVEKVAALDGVPIY
jgi:LysM repeat protein/ABC-type branched-subunit amino acid transport system substrate-binding protein